MTDDDFVNYQGFDLVSFEGTMGPQSDLTTFVVDKRMPLKELRARIADYYDLKESEFRVWVLGHRMNRTIRPTDPASGGFPGKPLALP